MATKKTKKQNHLTTSYVSRKISRNSKNCFANLNLNKMIPDDWVNVLVKSQQISESEITLTLKLA